MARTFIEFDAGKFFKNINKQFSKEVDRKVLPLIKKTILSGMSPVRGKGKYQKYSGSYKKQIRSGRYPGKKISPVNLKLTGNMLSGFKTRPLLRGGISIFNAKRLVKYHNNPEVGSKIPERKMLPDENGQAFIKRIDDEIKKQLETAISKVLKK